MGVSLQKGQKVDLTKGKPELKKLMIGLGWDANTRGGSNIDCDASVIMLDDNGKLSNKRDLIYFGNLKSVCGSVRHSGDNLTGHGDGDDEQIVIELDKIPENYSKLVFVVNIYNCKSRRQDFGMIANAFIRVVDPSNNTELCKFNLTDNYGERTTLITAEIYRYHGEWKFAAIGEGTTDTSLSEIAKKYQ